MSYQTSGYNHGGYSGSGNAGMYSSCGYGGGYSGGGSSPSNYMPQNLYASASQVANYSSPSMHFSRSIESYSSHLGNGAYQSIESSSLSSSHDLHNHSHDEHFTPTPFLNEVHPQFVEDAEDLKEYIKETFRTITGEELPTTISFTLCNTKKFEAYYSRYGGTHAHGILGFSINKRGFGVSEIFVRQGTLGEVLLTIGHEIGHVMSLPLKTAQNEEAKAYAFSFAWMETIREHNIAQLQHAINLHPAQNGIHDTAFYFVQQKRKVGISALTLFHNLIQQECEV